MQQQLRTNDPALGQVGLWMYKKGINHARDEVLDLLDIDRVRMSLKESQTLSPK